MTAAEYVAAAKRAARDMFGFQAPHRPFPIGETVYVGSEGEWQVHSTSLILRITLSARFTPENTASEAALVRALLASAVTFYPRQIAGMHVAQIGAAGSHQNMGAATEDAARNALLDALLAPALDHGDRA